MMIKNRTLTFVDRDGVLFKQGHFLTRSLPNCDPIILWIFLYRIVF